MQQTSETGHPRPGTAASRAQAAAQGAVPVAGAARPGVSVAAGRKGFKAELDDVRERMRGLGLGYDEIAAEIGRRYRVRPRESYRLAWGWTLNHAAERFNALAAQEGADSQARAGMTGAHLCEHERWPHGGRKPSVFMLVMLARMYETDPLCLLDLADHENLDPKDRLTLIRPPQRPRAAGPFGEKLTALMSERGLSLRELARRVPCDHSHLSKLAHGDKGASEQLAARLDRVLDAGGELASLAGPPARRDNRPESSGHAAHGGAHGLSLSLPYVPGRLVIEISDPAADAGQDSAEPAGRQLALVRDLPGRARQDSGR
jgi:transcriptional regulator with XRE-family HTH domain